MEDMTQPDTSKYQNYTAPDGSRYKREGETWVLQDPGQLEDVAKGARAGLGTGIHKALTFPGNLGEMGLAGAQYIAGKDSPLGGDIQHLRDEYTYPLSYEGSKDFVNKAFPTNTYEPQTTLGNVAKTGADILPSAALGVLGEGALGAAYGPAAVRAGLSTAGGALGGGLTHDTMPLLEGPAEAAGMLAGMGGPSFARTLIKPPKGGVMEKVQNLGSKTIENLGPAAVMGTAGAGLAHRYGFNPFYGADIGALSGYLGGGPVMKAGKELAGAVGSAITPKVIPQTASAMVKALSKKSPYNAQGLDTATAAALLAGQGAPGMQSIIGPP